MLFYKLRRSCITKIGMFYLFSVYKGRKLNKICILISKNAQKYISYAYFYIFLMLSYTLLSYILFSYI